MLPLITPAPSRVRPQAAATRQQIADFYKRRRLGGIPDAKWNALEADIVRAAGEGRIAGALGPDGTEISRLR